MKNIPNRIGHKIGMIVVCISICFMSCFANIKKANALFFETWAVSEVVLAICGVFGIGVGIGAATDDNFANYLGGIYDKWVEGASNIGGTVADGFTNFIDGCVDTGQIACDELVEYYDVFYDWWCSLDLLSNQGPPDLELAFPGLSSLGISGIAMTDKMFGSYRDNFFETGLQYYEVSTTNVDYPYNAVRVFENNFINLYYQTDGSFILNSSNIYYPTLPLGMHDNNNNVLSLPTTLTNSQYDTNLVIKDLYLLGNLEDYRITIYNDSFRFYSIYGEMGMANNLNGEWVLDPDWSNALPNAIPDVKLLDGTKDVWTNDSPFINDIDNIRVVGQDLTYSADGTVTSLGTLDIPHLLDYPKDMTWADFLTLLKAQLAEKEAGKDLTIDTPIVDVIPGSPPTVGGINDLSKYALDWKNVFPFCIPFDLIDFIGVLDAPPKAPHFVWNYDFYGIKGTVDIDLKEYEQLASLCRLMMDLCFIGGLIFITRDMIRG